jgi:hypothetical protein
VAKKEASHWILEHEAFPGGRYRLAVNLLNPPTLQSDGTLCVRVKKVVAGKIKDCEAT